jgi:BirA family transcriptional regulator, biotin operon repressor / biotin---[acetyl-CoA-carboxylase] ligase
MPRPDASHDAPLLEFEVLDSTNSEAMRRAAAGERGPVWLLAHRQTAGRGRSGRGWETPAGNLALTHLFTPGCPAAAVPQLSLLVGVAVHDALAAVWSGSADALRLKWPNDLMIGAAKVGGILVEASTFGHEPVVAIGIGVNIGHAPDVAGRSVTCLADHVSVPPVPVPLARAIASAFAHWREIWRRGEGFGGIREAWLARATPIGEPMSVNTGQGSVSGTFAGLDSDGALLLCDATGRHRRFTFGDVSLGTGSRT